MPELKNSRERFYAKLEIELPSDDPTIPERNFFSWLGLDEAESDSEIVKKVEEAYSKQSDQIRKFRNIDQHESGIAGQELTKAKICLSNESDINEHREKLKELRTEKLLQDANSLRKGDLTQEIAKDILSHQAGKLGFPDDQIDGAVKHVLDAMGPWKKPPKPSPPQVAPPSTSTPKTSAKHRPLPQVLFVGLTAFVIFIVVSASALFIPIWTMVACIIAIVITGWLVFHTRARKFAVWGGAFAAGFFVSVWLWLRPPSCSEYMINVQFPEDAPASLALVKPQYVCAPGKFMNEKYNNSLTLATDANPATRWVGTVEGNKSWFEVNFGKTVPVDGIVLISNGDENGNLIQKARLEFDSGESVELQFKVHAGWQVRTFDLHETSKVRFVILSSYGEEDSNHQVSINEIWFYQAETAIAKVNWEGSWTTSWGDMTLRQKDYWVFGSFNNTPKTKIIAKRMREKNLLIGTWSKEPTRTPPNDAGDIELVRKIVHGNEKLQGRFRYGSSGKWDSAEWYANRKDTN